MSAIKNSNSNIKERLELLYQTTTDTKPVQSPKDSLSLLKPLLHGKDSFMARAISLGLVAVIAGSYFHDATTREVSDLPSSARSIQQLFIAPITAADSTVTGIVDPISMSSSFYWTLVLKSKTGRSEEAMADILLPQGAVVSRATLWVNGIPQEAAFNATETVSIAYNRIAHGLARDPLLVTWKAPNKISVKASPVPVSGDMTIRLGLTVPLKVEQGGKCSVPLPSIENSNFTIAKQNVHIESSANLSSPAPFVKVDYTSQGRSILKANCSANELRHLLVETDRPANLLQVATRATHSGTPSYIVATVKNDAGDVRVDLTKQDSKPRCKYINSDHAAYRLSSLWASQEINRLLADGNTQAAMEIGTVYRVVSPVTGATVLEDNSQYNWFGLHRNRYMVLDRHSLTGSRGAEPMLQGATNGTIGPQADGTIVQGVNTAGVVRVNHLANLESIAHLGGPVGDWLIASTRDANLFGDDQDTSQISGGLLFSLLIALSIINIGVGPALMLFGLWQLIARRAHGLSWLIVGTAWLACGLLAPVAICIALPVVLLFGAFCLTTKRSNPNRLRSAKTTEGASAVQPAESLRT